MLKKNCIIQIMNIICNKYLYFISFIFLIALCSCENETFTPAPVDGEEEEYTFNITLGGIGTKAMDDVDENDIEDIDVLVFKEGHLLYRSKAIPGTIQEEGNTYTQKNFKVKLTTDNALNNVLVIIANARESVDNANIESLISKPMDEVMKNITFKIEGNGNDDRWPAHLNGGSSPVRLIPMWGQSKRTSISKDMEMELQQNPIPLFRALARVDVINKATNFNLEAVYFYKYNRVGCVAPGPMAQWDEHPYTKQPRVKNVTLPNDPDLVSDLLEYPVDSERSVGSIYMMEIDRAADNDYENASCLILQGKYKDGSNQSSYYRIDFEIVWYTEDGTGMIIEAGLGEFGQKRTFARILRNHIYEISINSVSRDGSASLDEALKKTDTQTTSLRVKAATWTRKPINIIF